MRIPSWLGADPPLHSEAVYIGADRPTIRRSCLHSGDGPYIYPFETGVPTQTAKVLFALPRRTSGFAALDGFASDVWACASARITSLGS